MLSLYTLSIYLVLYLIIILFTGMIVQIFRLLILYVQNLKMQNIFVVIFEFLIALHLLNSLLMLGFTVGTPPNKSSFLILTIVRYFDIGIVLLGIKLSIVDKETKEAVVSGVAALTTLPCFDGVNSVYFFIVVNIYFFARVVFYFHKYLFYTEKTITRLTVKDAIDILPSGILFGDRNKVYIINKTMTGLMNDLNCTETMDVYKIWNYLANHTGDENITGFKLRNRLIFRYKTDKTWAFSQKMIYVGGKLYNQITAVDITCEDKLMREIETVNLKLERSGRKIVHLLKNIDHIEKDNELIKMKFKLHDVIGQRLSILQRFLENPGSEKSLDRLKPLINDLISDLGTDSEKTSSRMINELTDELSLIGVNIRFEGFFPKDETYATGMIKIIREASTNAIRHAESKNIYVSVVREDSNIISMNIINDGISPVDPVIEGDGIKGMRRRAEELGGKLTFRTKPGFTIQLELPTKAVV